MTINWIDVAQKSFDLSGKKKLHVSDIASCIQDNSLISQSMSTEDIKSKITSSLANNVRKKDALFTKVKNKGKKSTQRGVYALKRKMVSSLPLLDPLEGGIHEKNFRGKAGEYALISELLFRGYNASLVSVDVGMDIIAFKDNKTFHIQVKTSKQSSNGIHKALIQETKFEHANDIYYVVVMRHNGTNKFFIITSNDLRTLRRKGILGEGKNINISLSLKSDKYYLSGTEPVQNFINDFDSIR